MADSFAAFGPLITPEDVEHEVEDFLKRWLPTYLAWVEADAFGMRDPDDAERVEKNLAPIASWERASEVRKWPESQLPAIVVVNQGTTGDPHDDGSGNIAATWVIGVLCVAMADTPDNTRKLAGRYAAAVYALMIHLGSIDGFAERTEWAGMSTDPLPYDDEARSLAAAMPMFRVTVRPVANTYAGIAEPPDDPFAGVPEPQTPTSKSLEIDKQ